MLRTFMGALLAVVIVGGILLADEAKGKFKKVEKGTVTITVDGKDVEYKIGKQTKVYDGDTEVTDKKERQKLLKGLTEGTEITVNYDKDGDKITVKELKVKK